VAKRSSLKGEFVVLIDNSRPLLAGDDLRSL
jgi:hypothetical protein